MTKSVEESTKTTVSGHSAESEATAGVESRPLKEQSDVSAAELSSGKNEKLARIRLAIELGHYDSDVIFDKALSQMLRRLEESEDGQ